MIVTVKLPPVSGCFSFHIILYWWEKYFSHFSCSEQRSCVFRHCARSTKHGETSWSDCPCYSGAVTQVQGVAGPFEAEENMEVQRGTGCWRWQIAAASRASSITQCDSHYLWRPQVPSTCAARVLWWSGVDASGLLSCSGGHPIKSQRGLLHVPYVRLFVNHHSSTEVGRPLE